MSNEIHITGSGVTIIGRPIHINGNGINRTKIVADNYFVLRNNATGNVVNINDCWINFAVDGPYEASTGAKLSNVLVDGATATSAPNSGGESIVGCATEITGCTFKNCRFAGVVGNSRGVVDAYPLGATVTNSLFLNQSQWMSAVFCYGATITGSTFATGNTGNVVVYNKATPTYIDKCIFVSTSIGGTGWQITSSNYVWVKLSNTTMSSASITTQETNNLFEFSGHNTFNNVTISGPGRIGFEAGSITESTDGTGWRINLAGSTNRVGNSGEISGCTISGKSYSTGCLYLYGGSRLVNSLITGNAMTVNAGQVEVENNGSKSPVLIKGTSITGNTRGSYGGAFDALTTNGRVLIVNSIIDGCYINPGSRTWVYFNNITFPRVGWFYNEIPSQYSYYAPCIRLESGSTISVVGSNLADTRILMQTPVIAIGTYSSDETFEANTDHITFVKKDGSSILITGIGTYIRVDGVNDFSPIYKFTIGTGTGENTFHYGLTTAAAGKWLVPQYGMTSATAILTAALASRNTHFMNVAGEVIFGGTLTLPSGATISCVYANGVEQSKVTVTGGSMSLSGTCYMRGTLDMNNNIFLSNSTSIIGAGSGSIIDFKNAGHVEARSISTSARYVVIKNGKGLTSSDSGGGGGGGWYSYYGSLTLVGCVITGCTSAGRGGGVHCVGHSSCTINGCTISNCRSGSYGSGLSAIWGTSVTIANTLVTGCTGSCGVFLEGGNNTVTNCRIYNNISQGLRIYSGTTTVSGSTVDELVISGGAGAKCILSGTNRITKSLTAASNAVIEIQSGTTVNIQGITTNITAGTISVLGSCTIVNTSGTATTVNAGTYTTISTAGVAS